MKLHLGCGSKKLKGWVNIDSVEACNPDMIQDITQPLPFEDLTVDEILAEDLLEHFDKYMRFLVFYEWARVLKVGGKITIQVPNFKKILFKYFKFGFENFVDFLFGENLWGSEFYLGHFGNHKWGYSKKTLKEFIGIFGIVPLEIKENGLNIRFIGEKKRNIELTEIGKIEIYSHANSCGEGRASVPFSFVKKKIEEFQDNINK